MEILEEKELSYFVEFCSPKYRINLNENFDMNNFVIFFENN